MAESQLQVEASLGADERAKAVVYLEALQKRLLGTLPTISLGQQLGEMRMAAASILGGLDTSPIRVSGDRPWTLAMLAEERAFARHYDAVTIAIADLFTLKAHLNLGHLHTGFAAFVMGLKDSAQEPPDYQRLISVISRLTAACVVRPIVSYSAMVRDRSNRTVGTVVAYPGEITAFCLGASLYTVAVRRLTGVDPSAPLPAMVVENAAALLRRQPAAASARFRELLHLTTPWA